MGDKEEVWDNWEDMAESGVLEKELEEAKKKREMQESQQQSQVTVPFLQEDSQRTAYQPQLKILKRPSDAGGDQNASEIKDVNKPKPKTLAEREEEYKQARLRILGSAETDFSEASPRPNMENRQKDKNSSGAGGSKR